jgi:competence ComEA-like helix-hairpin-helix protein
MFKKVLIIIVLLFPVLVLAEQIDINTATLSQLDELTGIGPTYAQRIIDGRPYSSVDDLDKVKGIGPATLQKIKDQGFACVNCATQTTQQPAEISQSENSGEQAYPAGIFINEILPNPEGADETNEWIELYNSNAFEVDLSGWQLQDIEGTPTTFTIPQNTKIIANGFLIFERASTKIMLNNDADGLNLSTLDKKVVNSVNYTKAPLGQSYNKTKSGLPAQAGWAWSTTMTPANNNIITGVGTKTSYKTLSNTKNSVNNNGIEAGLADLSQVIDTNQENLKNNNPWLLFFTALAIAAVSATILLIIKLKTKSNVRT